MSWMGYYYSRVTKRALRMGGRCDGKHLSPGLLIEIPGTCFAKLLTNRYTVHFICTFEMLLCHARKGWLSSTTWNLGSCGKPRLVAQLGRQFSALSLHLVLIDTPQSWIDIDKFLAI